MLLSKILLLLLLPVTFPGETILLHFEDSAELRPQTGGLHSANLLLAAFFCPLQGSFQGSRQAGGCPFETRSCRSRNGPKR